MRVAAKLVSVLVLGLMVIVAIEAYVSITQDIAIFHKETERDTSQLGRTLKDLIEDIWNHNVGGSYHPKGNYRYGRVAHIFRCPSTTDRWLFEKLERFQMISETTSLPPNFTDESASNDQVGIMTRPQESASHLPDSKSILLAEDDDEMRWVIALHLRRDGYRVTECRDGLEMLDHLNGYLENFGGAEEFNLIVSDIRMPGVFGLSVAAGAVDCQKFPPMILITAFGDVETHRAAEQYGVKAVLDKPFRIPELLQKVRENISA